VALSADGGIAVSGSDDRTVRVWDLSSGQCRATLQGHTDWVISVALSADGGTAVSGSNDQTVRVSDLSSGQCRAVHPHDSPEARRAWESVGTRGGFTVQRGGLFLEVRATGAEDVRARFLGQFTAAACSPDGRHVVAGDGRGQVYLFRLCSRDA
jgi:WD40 repeat protein